MTIAAVVFTRKIKLFFYPFLFLSNLEQVGPAHGLVILFV